MWNRNLIFLKSVSLDDNLERECHERQYEGEGGLEEALVRMTISVSCDSA